MKNTKNNDEYISDENLEYYILSTVKPLKIYTVLISLIRIFIIIALWYLIFAWVESNKPHSLIIVTALLISYLYLELVCVLQIFRKIQENARAIKFENFREYNEKDNERNLW